MKTFILFFFISVSLFAQKKDYNNEGGYLAGGYDVISYFVNQKAIEGKSKYQTVYEGVKLRFANQKNVNLFLKSPKKYLPQYGGYCAYAMGKTGEKVSINPKTFEIRNGKLYLFYNAWFNNTLDSWQEENTEQLRKNADKNWKKLIGS